MLTDEMAMRRCIQIGTNGLGTARPNPMVGAIIVNNDKIIGEGFTDPYGGPHAEVNAINSVSNHELLKSSTIYVTLEPCSHYGKTPPCSDLIVSKGIPKVVIGCLDDNPKVAGKGVQRLEANGTIVKTGILEQECKEHHKRFFTFFNKKRPYIILKWAESIDGFIAPESRDKKQPVWISNSFSRQLAHKWRADEQGILVGAKTVLEDNPSLTTREWGGSNPTRVVISSQLKKYKEFNVFNEETETIILSGKIESFIEEIFKQNINSIIVEGGSKTLEVFIESGLWDEARVFYGSKPIKKGIYGPKLNRHPYKIERIKSDLLKYYYND